MSFSYKIPSTFDDLNKPPSNMVKCNWPVKRKYISNRPSILSFTFSLVVPCLRILDLTMYDGTECVVELNIVGPQSDQVVKYG